MQSWFDRADPPPIAALKGAGVGVATGIGALAVLIGDVAGEVAEAQFSQPPIAFAALAGVLIGVGLFLTAGRLNAGGVGAGRWR